MSYDYAREIDEAMNDYDAMLDDTEIDEPPRRRRYSCSDRMCGALDCANCHPGQHEEEE